MYSHDFESYHNYLKNKSLLGSIYRKYFLYPRLCKELQGKALDIGCGTGEFCRFRPNTDGADINPLNVDWLAKFDRKGFLISSDSTISVADSSYDAAVLDNVLEHIEKPELLINEIRRLLKPQGILLVGVPELKDFMAKSTIKFSTIPNCFLRPFRSMDSLWSKCLIPLLNQSIWIER